MCSPKQGQQAAFRRGSRGSNEFVLWDVVLAGWLCRALVDLTTASWPELSKMTSQSLSSATKVWEVVFDVGMLVLGGARKRHRHNFDRNHCMFNRFGTTVAHLQFYTKLSLSWKKHSVDVLVIQEIWMWLPNEISVLKNTLKQQTIHQMFNVETSFIWFHRCPAFQIKNLM